MDCHLLGLPHCQKVGVVTPGHLSPMIAATMYSFFHVFSITVPGDQKLADSIHINSDMRHVCLQLLAADCQARPLSNSCSVAANFGQLLRGLTHPTLRNTRDGHAHPKHSHYFCRILVTTLCNNPKLICILYETIIYAINHNKMQNTSIYK